VTPTWLLTYASVIDRDAKDRPAKSTFWNFMVKESSFWSPSYDTVVNADLFSIETSPEGLFKTAGVSSRKPIYLLSRQSSHRCVSLPTAGKARGSSESDGRLLAFDDGSDLGVPWGGLCFFGWMGVQRVKQ
jgi:hypothetical protein